MKRELGRPPQHHPTAADSGADPVARLPTGRLGFVPDQVLLYPESYIDPVRIVLVSTPHFHD